MLLWQPVKLLAVATKVAQVSQTGVYIGDQIHRRSLDAGKTLHRNIGGSQHQDHTTIVS